MVKQARRDKPPLAGPKGKLPEEDEMNSLMAACVEKIHSMREDKLSYKERQGSFERSQFALPGKGDRTRRKTGWFISYS